MYLDFSRYPKMHYLQTKADELRECLTQIHHFGIVYLGYDTFQQGETIEILEYLRNNKFNIIKAKLRVNLSKTEIENLFLPNNSCIECGSFRWWMVQDTLDLGPLLSVIIHKKEATPDNHCLKQLNKLKGFGDPFVAKEGTIRERFSAINYSMNMIHIPDDYLDFIKDSTPFFSTKEIKVIIKDNATLDLEGASLLSKDELFDIKTRMVRSNKYSFVKSINLLKYRLVNNLEKSYKERERLLQLYRELIEATSYQKRHEQLKQLLTSYTEEKRLLNSFMEELENQNQISINRMIEDDKLLGDVLRLRLLMKFSAFESFINLSQKDFDYLHLLNVDIDNFDKHIILTSALPWKTYGDKNED